MCSAGAPSSNKNVAGIGHGLLAVAGKPEAIFKGQAVQGGDVVEGGRDLFDRRGSGERGDGGGKHPWTSGRRFRIDERENFRARDDLYGGSPIHVEFSRRAMWRFLKGKRHLSGIGPALHQLENRYESPFVGPVCNEASKLSAKRHDLLWFRRQDLLRARPLSTSCAFERERS